MHGLWVCVCVAGFDGSERRGLPTTTFIQQLSECCWEIWGALIIHLFEKQWRIYLG